MSRRKHHSEHHEEHIDESWLIPYADILTLLLALFIVLFASAQMDQKKFQVIAQSFNSAFSGSTSLMEHSPSQATTAGSPNQIDKVNTNTNMQAMQESAQLLEAKKALDRYIQENKLDHNLETQLSGEGLMVRIKDTALFPSGSAELLPQSRLFGAEIAKMIASLPQRVVISGHTDNVPINTPEFPTNWDLSSKRALNFMKFILAQGKELQPERFSSIGYGEYRPLAPNDSADGRANNRRVEVLIVRQYAQ